MRKKSYLLLISTILLAFLFCSCNANTTSNSTPSFTKISLNCSEKDAVKVYGECTQISSNNDGGKVYTYSTSYNGQDGALYITFNDSGVSTNIQWICLPQSEKEFTDIVDHASADLNKKYGDTYFKNESNEVSIWNANNSSVTMFAISDEYYTVILSYSISAPEEVASAIESDDAANAEKLAVTSKIYHIGETAEYDDIKLTVNTVDATPEFAEYTTSDSDTTFFFISFELENTSQTDFDTHSIFSVYADEEKASLYDFYEKYNGVSYFDEYHSLKSGRKVSSYICATVPVDWTEITFVYKDSIRFSFTHDDLGKMSSKIKNSESAPYHVGETMNRNGLEFTLLNAIQTSAVYHNSSLYFSPQNGKEFLILFFDITNSLDQPQKIKYYYRYDIFIDDYSASMTYFNSTEVNGKRSLYEQDGQEIPAGKLMSGYMAIEVPIGWQKVELVSRQGTFEITPDVVTMQ